MPAELIDAAEESDMVAEHSAESAGIDNSRRVEPSEAHRHTEKSTCISALHRVLFCHQLPWIM